ncbi:unnamed protein product [Rangifer tarandus platyrhynchus]|uniref:Uncharacterized protein n=1 Tax=Rangifer tarandus platyrhynchus TaxID=3082113 RepID=A0ABN8YMG7_RANTA|nr:unnamed protein product [Rangifer tarandus platyrhynchus]
MLSAQRAWRVSRKEPVLSLVLFIPLGLLPVAAEGRKETTADVLTREGAGVGAEEVRRDAGRTRAVSGRLPAKHSLTDRKAHGPRTGRRLPGARDGAGTGRRGVRPQQESLRTPQSLSFF